MAACSLGASSFKISSLNLGSARPKSNTVQLLHCLKGQNSIQCDGFGLVISRRSKEALIGCRCSITKADPTETSEEATEESKYSGVVSTLIPNAFDVEYLLNEICDTTSIAEVDIKLGGFKLHVKRNLTDEITVSPPQVSSPVNVTTPVETSTVSSGSVSLSITKSISSSESSQILMDKATDEGLVLLQSPRVGLFRRSRMIKGKRAPPLCKEKQQVKEGQIICYIEQLGNYIPLESDITGEVTKILLEDGEPVGYGDALIAVLPSFPGIKKLQ